MRLKVIGLAICGMLMCQPAGSPSAAEVALGTSGGIYTVPALINGSMAVEFLVDPGAGVVVIPVSVLRDLVRSGTVTESDVVGIGTAALADSSLYLTAKVRLRELRVGNTIARDVIAAVSPGLSQPLLGQSFFHRFAFVTFDNRRNVMILSDEALAPVASPPATAWARPYPAYPPAGPFSGQSDGSYAYGPGFGR